MGLVAMVAEFRASLARLGQHRRQRIAAYRGCHWNNCGGQRPWECHAGDVPGRFFAGRGRPAVGERLGALDRCAEPDISACGVNRSMDATCEFTNDLSTELCEC